MTYVDAYCAYGTYLRNLFDTNTQAAIILLRNEENNLLYALDLGRQHGQWDRIGGVLYALWRIYTTQGRWMEWERLVTEMGAQTSDGVGESLLGRESAWVVVQTLQGNLADFRRDYERSQAIRLRLKDHYARIQDDRNLAITFHQLGIIAEERRRFDEAESWYRRSLEIKERIGDEHGQAITLHQLGRIAQERGKTPEAFGFYRRAEAVFLRMNDPHSLEIVRNSLRRIEAPEADPPAEG
jgi:tetratricopeptide (TPR) repeat protein